LSAAAPDLRDRLAELEVEHATLLAELRAFEADYLREVGVIAVQVQELEARILALAAARSGFAADRAAADAAASRYRETTTALRSVPAPAGPPPTEDLKGLFRDAAKRMHPDLAPTDAARGHAEAVMKRLNQAYRAADGEAILDLMRQWEASPLATPTPGAEAPAEAARRVAGLEAAVARAQRRLDEARASELADLMERSMAAAAAGRDYLAELRAGAEAALAAARARLGELGG
jgi:hypothetical protein